MEPYRRAFHTIVADPAQLLVVVEHGDEVVGAMQLSFIPGLARPSLAWLVAAPCERRSKPSGA